MFKICLLLWAMWTLLRTMAMPSFIKDGKIIYGTQGCSRKFNPEDKDFEPDLNKFPFKVVKTTNRTKKKIAVYLTRLQYLVTQCNETDPFHYGFTDFYGRGDYYWAVCDQPLFSYKERVPYFNGNLLFPWFYEPFGYTYLTKGFRRNVKIQDDASVKWKDWDSNIGIIKRGSSYQSRYMYQAYSSSLWYLPHDEKFRKLKSRQDTTFFRQIYDLPPHLEYSMEWSEYPTKPENPNSLT